MKFKRKDVAEIWSVLDSMKNAKTNIRTTFTIAKNRNIIQPEIDAIREAVKPSPQLAEYEKKRLDLCNKYCIKDSDGNPMINNGNFLFDAAGREIFEKEFNELKKEMPEAVEESVKQSADLESLMSDDVELELTSFKLDQLPDFVLSVQQLEILDKHGLISSE